MRRIGVVVGKTGYGKSYLSKQAIPKGWRVVIFDCLAEYNFPNFQIITSLRQFRAVLKDCQFRYKPLRVTLRLGSIDAYDFALSMVYIVGDILVVVEEISNFSNAHKTTPTLESIIRFGRHKSVSILGITQRFSDLSLLLRNNLDMVVAFNLSMPTDLDYLASIDWIGEAAYDLPKLDKRQYKTWYNV
jgi:hypothetical protein